MRCIYFSFLSRLLIDAGEANKEEYTSLLASVLQKLQARVSHIVITHWHHDHLGGLPNVLATVCSDQTPTVSKISMEDCNMQYPLRGEGNVPPATLPAHVKRDMTYVWDGDVLTVEGATLRVIATPGHTKDHLSLWFEEENSVFTGDCILGEGSAVFEDLASYMNSLEKLLTLKPDMLYPGHGPVVKDGKAKIQEYIAHRNAREKQVVDCLENSAVPVSAYQIVARIYKDVDEVLWIGAENNVRLHLDKLLKEGKVVQMGEADGKYLWRLCSKI